MTNTALREKVKAFIYAHGGQFVRHSGRTLSRHLMGTFDLLDREIGNDTLSAAGGLHSIFGTNSFRQAIMPLEAKKWVTLEFGERVTKLVELVATTDRPKGLQNMKPINWRTGEYQVLTQEEFDALCVLEAANLLEQKPDRKLVGNIARAWELARQDKTFPAF